MSQPLPSKIPTWPRERDLSTYSKYTAIDFERELSDATAWMDVGCRTGKALYESKKFSNASLLGVNAHQIELLPGITPLYSTIPHDDLIYTKFRKKIDILTDIYSAFSYENDPIAVLVYEACLLKSGGKAVIVTLEAKLGNRINRQDLTSFFEKELGQQIAFQRFRTYSDNTRTPISSLRITITGSCRSKHSLETLLLKARQMIGVPKMKKIIYSPTDKSTELWKIVYEKT